MQPHKVVALIETIIGFLFSCYASPQLYCVFRGMESFGHCSQMAKLLVVCAGMFFIPGIALYFHVRLGVVAQLLMPVGIYWIWLQF